MTYFKILVIIIYLLFCSFSLSNDKKGSENIISKEELKIFKLALKDGNRAKWTRSIKHIKKIQNEDARKIIEWRWLISSDGIASKSKLKDFYNSNQNWPRIKNIQKKIETKINVKNFENEMVWFQENPPITGLGKIKLAEVLLINKFNKEAEWLFNNTWKNHSFNLSEEKYILKNYGKLIGKQTHNKRIERLIWVKSWSSARRQLNRVDKNVMLLSKAKILLSRRRGNVDNAIAAIPSELRTSESLVFERIKWRRRAQLESKSLELLMNYKGQYSMPKYWWREINFHVRKQISYGNYDNAIAVLKRFNKGSDDYSSESSWLIGWLSLTFLKNPEVAYEYFKIMFYKVKTPISKARASFWAGKAAKTLGDKNSAATWFNRASAFPATFYGQLAVKELGKNLYLPSEISNFTKKDYEEYKNLELTRCLILLNKTGSYKLSRVFAMRLVELAKSKKEIHMLASLLKEIELVSLSIFVGKKSIYKDIYIPTLNFPIPNNKLLEDIKSSSVLPLAETLAITRQESAFNPRAISRAGARGLMQVMPRTARLTAKKINYKYNRANLTKKPSYNVKIGSSYFKEMLKNFNGSYILSLAAYNAGPNRVKRWLKVNGDPRKGEVDPVTWIELIPITETRNYVQRVIEGMYMYRVILNNGGKKTLPANKIKLF